MFFCIGFASNAHNNYCDSQRKVSHCNQIPSSPALLFSWAIFLLGLFFFEVPPLSSCEVLDSVCILCPKEPHHLLHPQLDSLLLPLYGSAVIPSPHPSHHLRLWCVFTFTSTPSAFEPVSVKAILFVVLAASWSRRSVQHHGPLSPTTSLGVELSGDTLNFSEVENHWDCWDMCLHWYAKPWQNTSHAARHHTDTTIRTPTSWCIQPCLPIQIKSCHDKEKQVLVYSNPILVSNQPHPVVIISLSAEVSWWYTTSLTWGN